MNFNSESARLQREQHRSEDHCSDSERGATVAEAVPAESEQILKEIFEE